MAETPKPRSSVEAARRTLDGREYESLTELVVRLLSRQTEIATHDLRRRARVRGRSTTHEIDVWWEPEVNGTRRQVAFQCKDLARPVDQGEMLKFRAVLDDLDAHPLGVFVARGRYQRGAIMVAAMSNILRLSIDRVGDDEELVVEHTEILGAEIKLRRDDPDRESAPVRTITTATSDLLRRRRPRAGQPAADRVRHARPAPGESGAGDAHPPLS